MHNMQCLGGDVGIRHNTLTLMRSVLKKQNNFKNRTILKITKLRKSNALAGHRVYVWGFLLKLFFTQTVFNRGRFNIRYVYIRIHIDLFCPMFSVASNFKGFYIT